MTPLRISHIYYTTTTFRIYFISKNVSTFLIHIPKIEKALHYKEKGCPCKMSNKKEDIVDRYGQNFQINCSIHSKKLVSDIHPISSNFLASTNIFCIISGAKIITFG